MSKTILVCNQKGGVGKSLIADELAFSFERTNTPLNFYDLDDQGGTIHKTHKTDNAEVTVVDTPGALQPALKEWLKGADLAIVPTRTTSRDIEPLIRMQEAIAVNAKCPVIYVLNGWNRFKASRDFMAWFIEQDGPQMIAKLPQSELFVQAGADGVSIVQFKKSSKAAGATLDLVNMIRQMIGMQKES